MRQSAHETRLQAKGFGEVPRVALSVKFPLPIPILTSRLAIALTLRKPEVEAMPKWQPPDMLAACQCVSLQVLTKNRVKEKESTLVEAIPVEAIIANEIPAAFLSISNSSVERTYYKIRLSPRILWTNREWYFTAGMKTAVVGLLVI